jgi:hypothetical protein
MAWHVGMRKPHAVLGSNGREMCVTAKGQGHWSWSSHVWPQIEVYSVGNHILQETKLGEYLPRIVGWVCAFALRLTTSLHYCELVTTSSYCELLVKRNANAHTPLAIWDKYSPDRMGSHLFRPSQYIQSCT